VLWLVSLRVVILAVLGFLLLKGRFGSCCSLNGLDRLSGGRGPWHVWCGLGHVGRRVLLEGFPPVPMVQGDGTRHVLCLCHRESLSLLFQASPYFQGSWFFVLCSWNGFGSSWLSVLLECTLWIVFVLAAVLAHDVQHVVDPGAQWWQQVSALCRNSVFGAIKTCDDGLTASAEAAVAARGQHVSFTWQGRAPRTSQQSRKT